MNTDDKKAYLSKCLELIGCVWLNTFFHIKEGPRYDAVEHYLKYSEIIEKKYGFKGQKILSKVSFIEVYDGLVRKDMVINDFVKVQVAILMDDAKTLWVDEKFVSSFPLNNLIDSVKLECVGYDKTKRLSQLQGSTDLPLDWKSPVVSEPFYKTKFFIIFLVCSLFLISVTIALLLGMGIASLFDFRTYQYGGRQVRLYKN